MATETKPSSVLIVDDEALVRRMIRKGLASEGYICYEADNADKAINCLHASPAEVVLLDIRMPGKTGQELLPEISATFPRTAVIMATADIEPNTIIDCLKNGASDYITKPFNVEQIIEAIKTVLEKKRLEFELKQHQGLIEGKVEEQTAELQKVFSGAIESLIIALEAKDRYTAGHSRRVTDLAVRIGKAAGLSEAELEDLRWAALLHDIGKIGIDPTVLNKPDHLTPDEYRYILNHANIGGGIVQPLVNQKIVAIIEHHHDRYDGGTPNQKVGGNDIPLGARILALADTYDAMTSDRPYRNALPAAKALDEIRRNTGSQFDPGLVQAFLKIDIPARS
jgi:putative two-component system response regulator